MSGPRKRLFADSLTTRFVAVAASAVLGAIVLGFAIFAALRPTEVPVYSGRWLVDQVANVVGEIFERPAAERRAFLAEIGDPPGLTMQWRETKPSLGNEPPRWAHSVILTLLRGALGDQVKQVLVESHRSIGLWRTQPREMEHGMGPGEMRYERERERERDHDRDRRRERMRDFPVPGPFVVAIEGRDGSWVTIASAPDHQARRWLAALAWIGSLVLVVGGLGWWSARRLTAPLDRLAAATLRFGIDRNAPPMPAEGPRELQDIALAFNAMRDRIAKFVDERTGLVAAISHDLRTPLTRLRLRAEAIADEEERTKVLGDIADMEAMIAATLDFAREDRRDEPLQSVDLASLMQSLADERVDSGDDVAYDGPDHAILSCRPTALKRAFANLIDNAVKYGGSCRLALADGRAAVVVTVTDPGPGIPPAEREAAFRPFHRLESSRSRETGGVGLGLSIARDVLSSHGGSITLGDAVPHGLKVTVELPKLSAR